MFFQTMLATVLVTAPGTGAAVRLPQIKFEKYVLPNGLQVILQEDHSTPLVAVNVWYHVGSKNERPGRTGFAHLFEHMMFQGSEHYDKSYITPLQKAGARLNGSTATDRTNYWETVPSNYLELALWLESDRMGFLLPAMSQAKLDNQRAVVKNERRQSYENRPYGLTREVLHAALYPPEHPYSWLPIGSMADVTAATREDIADFFRRYYHPANASLCIAGDIDPAHAKQLVAKYFGPLPAGPKVEKVHAGPVELNGERRVRMTDRVGLPRVYIDWPSVPSFAPDDAELDVLGQILATGKTSRLYQSLVHEKQLAQDVDANQQSDELAGQFTVVLTARPDHSLAELEAAAQAEIDRLQAEGPTAEELTRVINNLEVQFVRALEPLGDFGGRADRLNLYNVMTGDPGYVTQDFARYLAVDAAGVRRVAQKYLTANRVVLEVMPGAKLEIADDPRPPADAARSALAQRGFPPHLSPPAVVHEDFSRDQMPAPGPEPQFTPPPIQRDKLSNGLELIVVEHHEFPLVDLHLVSRAGRICDPADKPGLAALTAAMWDEGTRHRTSQQIAHDLAAIGATLSCGIDWDVLPVRLFTLKRQLPTALEIFADVLENPTFPAEELERQRHMALDRLVQVRNEPIALAQLAVRETLYGANHPYGRPSYGTPQSLAAIGRDDLEHFYRHNLRPDTSCLVAVGDITMAELKAELEGTVGRWPSPGTPRSELAVPPPAPQLGAVRLIDKPGAAQSVIAMTLLGTQRKTPDYFPLVVMNAMFGGQFTSRLNLNLREEKGYTYGARSLFDWMVYQPGPFLATASVQTAVTAPSVTEFLKEFQGLRGVRPITAAELEFCKRYLTRAFPAGFETCAQVANLLEALWIYDLPHDYLNTYLPGVNQVTAGDVLRVAQRYLNMEQMAVIIVGDRARIEADLRKLPLGKDLTVCRFDEQFHIEVGDKRSAEK
jgi:zinc protease